MTFSIRNKSIVVFISTCISLVFFFTVNPLHIDSDSKLWSTLHLDEVTKLPLGVTIDNSLSEHNTVTFWPQFYTALLTAAPRHALPNIKLGNPFDTRPFVPFGNGYERQDLIHIDPEEETQMTDGHAWFIHQISSPSFPKPEFIPGSSGIVTSAGGKWFPEALVAIRMLRRTGSTLPVEVFLATSEEVEGDICQAVFPLLNAHCRIMTEIIDHTKLGLSFPVDITHYQLKAFAMMFSEFDNILWMDADEIPLIDPREMLEGELLRSKGLVTWQDYWAETMSPTYLRIANITGVNTEKSGYRASSETGQLLISKSVSLRTLELATYYNLFGPSHYYSLISQGAMGMGDKDTFLAAAIALDEYFWDIKTPIQTIGYYTHENGLSIFHRAGILQANPDIDYTRFDQGVNHTGFDFRPGELDDHFTADTYFQRVPSVFLHLQQVKPNAAVMLSSIWSTEIPQRQFSPKEDVLAAFGFDVEQAVWEEIVWTACGEELHGHIFWDWIDNPQYDRSGLKGNEVCNEIQKMYEMIFEG